MDQGFPHIRGQEVVVMRIFYIGQLWKGGTARERLKLLNTLGHSTVPFDVMPFIRSVPRLLQSIAWRFHAGPVVMVL